MTDPWILKYAPRTINEMVLDDELKTYFSNCISSKTLPNLCLAGNAGIGKTTLAKLLVTEFKCKTVKFQPCSVDGSIDMVKSTINDFCQIATNADEIKVVILDEADQLSQQAQMALRNIIVEALPDTRFILTCNYLDKIIPALQSRCTPVKLQFSLENVVKYFLNILKLEHIKTTKSELEKFIKYVVKPKFPDIRSIIEHLQLASNSGKLIITSRVEGACDDEVVKFIQQNMPNVNIIREYLLNNEEKFSADYIMLAGKLLDLYTQNNKAIILIADYIYKMTLVLDKEIQFYAMLVNLVSIGA